MMASRCGEMRRGEGLQEQGQAGADAGGGDCEECTPGEGGGGLQVRCERSGAKGQDGGVRMNGVRR